MAQLSKSTAEWLRERSPWRAMSRYLAIALPLHLVWEFAHMPLYDVWKTGTAEEIVYNGLHCTVGDLMIAAFSLLAAIVLAGWSRWPRSKWLVVSGTAILAGIGYTAFSEWHNVYVLQSWSYARAMPVVPGTGIGVSPLAQWLVVPTAALWLAWRLTPKRSVSRSTVQSSESG